MAPRGPRFVAATATNSGTMAARRTRGGHRFWRTLRAAAAATVVAVVGAAAAAAMGAAAYEVILDSRQQRCVTEELEAGTHVRDRVVVSPCA